MANRDLRRRWVRIERYLREALMHPDLPDDVRAEAEEFIDHNEFGVAFGYVVNVLVERGIELDARARRVPGCRLVRPSRQPLSKRAPETKKPCE